MAICLNSFLEAWSRPPLCASSKIRTGGESCTGCFWTQASSLQPHTFLPSARSTCVFAAGGTLLLLRFPAATVSRLPGRRFQRPILLQPHPRPLPSSAPPHRRPESSLTSLPDLY